MDEIEQQPLRTEVHGDWEFRLFGSTSKTDSQSFFASAEIYRDGELGCKLVTFSAQPTMAAALGAMRAQCQIWISDFDSRPHSGDTDFGRLK